VALYLVNDLAIAALAHLFPQKDQYCPDGVQGDKVTKVTLELR
jgi:hypothetical protein